MIKILESASLLANLREQAPDSKCESCQGGKIHSKMKQLFVSLKRI